MELSKAKAHLKISWWQFHQDTKALAEKLKQGDPYIAIIAMSRGGLIPAAIIAYELNIKYIDTYCLTSYLDQQQSAVVTLKAPLDWNDSRVLVVDDLVDSGTTFRFARQAYPDCHYATIYAKPTGKPYVDTYVSEMPQETWIDFPWD